MSEPTDKDYKNVKSNRGFISNGYMQAKSIKIKGNFRSLRCVTVDKDLKVNGNAYITVGDISARNIHITGNCRAEGYVFAEDKIVVGGTLKCYMVYSDTGNIKVSNLQGNIATRRQYEDYCKGDFPFGIKEGMLNIWKRKNK